MGLPIACTRRGRVAAAARAILDAVSASRSRAAPARSSSAPTARARACCCACCTGCWRRRRARIAWGGRAAAPARAGDGVPAAGDAAPLRARPTSRYALHARRRRAASEREQRARDALDERRACARSRDRPARVLSGGEQQRLALARAWALEPEVLFLDEPTASLDPRADARGRGRSSAQIHARGTEIVMTTHNLGQARAWPTRSSSSTDGRLRRARAGRSFFQRAAHAPRRRRSSKESCHGRSTSHARDDSRWRCSRSRSRPATGARAQDDSSPSRRPRRPSSRACSSTCCRCSRRTPASRCAWSRSAPARRSTSARRGDADVVFVHDQVAEEKFVAEGFGVKRLAGDVQRLRAGRAEGRSREGRRRQGHPRRAAARSQAAKAPFVSRGDKSGTHAAELRYWKAAGVDLDAKQGTVVPRDGLRHGARRSTPRRR